MRLTRLWVDAPLQTGEQLSLSTETSHYVLHVLRLRLNTPLIIFNGQGGEYQAVLTEIQKKIAVLHIGAYSAVERESALSLTLVQAVSRPEHIDYTMQKAVELGVTRIIPVISERSPPLNKETIAKREQHWQKILISACEQCGRNQIPTLYPAQPLLTWLAHPLNEFGILLDPTASSTLNMTTTHEKITVLVGAEGGLTETEISSALQAGYTGIRLGSRVLRTETAAIAILAICQANWGDLGHLSQKTIELR